MADRNSSRMIFDVQIRIMDRSGSAVYEFTTDENGETPTVPLETVSRDFSMNPYFSGIPYTSYHILANASVDTIL